MRLRRWRQGKEKCGAFPHLALNPDPAPVHFDDPPHEGQSDPGAIGARIQLVEETKNAVLMFRGDTHTIITYVEDGEPTLTPALPDLDARIGSIAYEFGSIVEQIL